MAIQIFITGGTFDKEYDEINGKLYFQDTHMREILKLGRAQIDVNIHKLMMIDSLDMTDSDRKLIVDNCKSVEEDQIIITHGTDTMTTTAKLLADRHLGKTIVLTGAMIPFKFGSSDGLFNLGAAIAFVQSLPRGVYIAMNGKCFNYDTVQKNKKTGVFEEI